jgi:hypothetical protein
LQLSSHLLLKRLEFVKPDRFRRGGAGRVTFKRKRRVKRTAVGVPGEGSASAERRQQEGADNEEGSPSFTFGLYRGLVVIIVGVVLPGHYKGLNS